MSSILCYSVGLQCLFCEWKCICGIQVRISMPGTLDTRRSETVSPPIIMISCSCCPKCEKCSVYNWLFRWLHDRGFGISRKVLPFIQVYFRLVSFTCFPTGVSYPVPLARWFKTAWTRYTHTFSRQGWQSPVLQKKRLLTPKQCSVNETYSQR